MRHYLLTDFLTDFSSLPENVGKPPRTGMSHLPGPTIPQERQRVPPIPTVWINMIPQTGTCLLPTILNNCTGPAGWQVPGRGVGKDTLAIPKGSVVNWIGQTTLDITDPEGRNLQVEFCDCGGLLWALNAPIRRGTAPDGAELFQRWIEAGANEIIYDCQREKDHRDPKINEADMTRPLDDFPLCTVCGKTRVVKEGEITCGACRWKLNEKHYARVRYAEQKIAREKSAIAKLGKIEELGELRKEDTEVFIPKEIPMPEEPKNPIISNPMPDWAISYLNATMHLPFSAEERIRVLKVFIDSLEEK